MGAIDASCRAKGKARNAINGEMTELFFRDTYTHYIEERNKKEAENKAENKKKNMINKIKYGYAATLGGCLGSAAIAGALFAGGVAIGFASSNWFSKFWSRLC